MERKGAGRPFFVCGRRRLNLKFGEERRIMLDRGGDGKKAFQGG